MSRKILRMIVVLASGMLLLSGCAKEKNSEIESEDIFEDVSSEENDDVIMEQISVGYGVESMENSEEFVYTGEPISFQFYMESDGKCTMGLKIFVNGRLQVYQVEGVSTNMHTIELNNERKTIPITLEPDCGKKGDKLQLLFVGVYNPVVMEPNKEGNLIFGNNQKMSSTVFQYIDMQQDARDVETKQYTDETVVYRVLTEEEKESYISTDMYGNCKDGLANLNMEWWDENGVMNRPIFSTNEAKTLKLKMFGGETGTYRVSFYNNFEKMNINGQEYIDILLKKGEEATYEVHVDEIPQGTNFYAMAISIDSLEYWDKSASIYMSK